MKILKAKIKPTSKYYANGLNAKGKAVWLQITGFTAKGDANYRIKAVKEFKNGLPVFFERWISSSDVLIRKFDDNQIKIPFNYENSSTI